MAEESLNSEKNDSASESESPEVFHSDRPNEDANDKLFEDDDEFSETDDEVGDFSELEPRERPSCQRATCMLRCPYGQEVLKNETFYTQSCDLYSNL